MAGDRDDEASPREEVGGPGGLTDRDDTTQADAGMAGGTGADAGESTANPLGTEPVADDDETGTD